MATELKQFFPDDDVSGLVSRKRRNSNLSIDLECEQIADDVSIRQRLGSSAECSREELDIDTMPRDFRRRTITQGRVNLI